MPPPCQPLDGTRLHQLRGKLSAFAQAFAALGFPGSSDGKASAYNAGDLGLIPGSGRYPGERNGNPLQYSCLENPMDQGLRNQSPWRLLALSQTKNLEKEMATHSSILAWRIPGTGAWWATIYGVAQSQTRLT